MNSTAWAILAAGVALGGAVLYTAAGSAGPAEAPANNVSVVDGTQMVEISVKGGYRPQKSAAKAGVPTTLRFVTDNTYDCSGSVRIPSIGYNAFLPSSGTTDVELGTPQAGVLRGSCSMGMYVFEIDFRQ